MNNERNCAKQYKKANNRALYDNSYEQTYMCGTYARMMKLVH